MRLFGLIGWPLGHSFSKRYFTEKFQREGIADAAYEAFPLENIAELPDLLAAQPELCGLNVTIPHKETVMPYLHRLDETAQAVGAVNCIRIRDGRLCGYNTDVAGFEGSLLQWLSESGVGIGSLQAVVLGSGGAAKAVAWVLQRHAVPFRYVSRRADGPSSISYADTAAFLSGKPGLIVNATPLGTYPDTENMAPLPLSCLQQDMLVFDLVYNPPETLLLREAKARGCRVMNGLDMLHRQAEEAWQIWQDQSPI